VRRITQAIILVVGLAAAAAPHAALAADVKLSDVAIDYDLLISGAPAAELQIDAALFDKSYQVTGAGQTTGLIDLLVRMRFSGNTSGKVARDTLIPAVHTHHYQERGSARDVRISYRKDGRAEVSADPPYDPSASRVPLTEDELFGTVDPASVFIVPALAGHGPLDAAQCSRQFGVLEGQIRINVAMRYIASAVNAKVSSVHYQGPLLRCGLSVKPVGGHKRGKFLDNLSSADDIEVWLAPVAEGRYLVPLHLSLPTPLGRAELDARRLKEKPAERQAALGK